MKLWQLLLIVIGGINILMGVTGLVDDLVTWKAWFEEGVLTHYRAAREFVSDLLPFRLRTWVLDALVIWSGFSFWSARAWYLYFSGPRSIERDFHSRWLHPLVIVGGPLGLVLLTKWAVEDERQFETCIAGFDEDGTEQVEHAEFTTGVRRDVGKSVLTSGVLLIAIYLALLFVASDALARITGTPATGS